MSARGDWRDGLPDDADRASLPAIERVQHDSRLVEPGDLFVCVPGLRVDGHDFAAAAVEAGAAALIAERGRGAALRTLGVPVVDVPSARRALSAIAAAHEGYPSERLTVVGVTGTNGKTTTTLLIQAALEAYGESAGLISTVETRVGATASANATRMSTPEAPEVQRLLADMVDAGNEYAVVEATSHGLALDRLADIAFDVAVLTNLGEDHLDFHGTIEAYAEAKLRLFQQLDAPTSKSVERRAVLNADDPAWRRFAAATRAPALTYGIDATDADVVAGEAAGEAHASATGRRSSCRRRTRRCMRRCGCRGGSTSRTPRPRSRRRSPSASTRGWRASASRSARVCRGASSGS